MAGDARAGVCTHEETVINAWCIPRLLRAGISINSLRGQRPLKSPLTYLTTTATSAQLRCRSISAACWPGMRRRRAGRAQHPRAAGLAAQWGCGGPPAQPFGPWCSALTAGLTKSPKEQG